MADKVKFEGTIRVEGSVEVVEKTLAELAKRAGIQIDLPMDPHGPHTPGIVAHFPFPFPGYPLPIWTLLSDAGFATKRIAAIGRNPKLGQVAMFRDPGIAGGRRYLHLHVADKIVVLNQTAFNKLVMDATAELNKLGPAHEIPAG